MDRSLILLPVGLFFFLIFFLMLFLIFFTGAIVIAFQRLGIPWFLAYFLFWLSLIGSFINIPVGEMWSEKEIVRLDYVSFFGIVYPVPRLEKIARKTVIAVNVGGCVIPVLVSILIILRLLVLDSTLLLRALIGVLIASVVFFFSARLVKGIGIVIPFFIPPLVSALLALILAPWNPTPVAYLCGTLGTLIGADLLNLPRIKRVGASYVSIGGAGTFDGIFLSGIIAVLLVF